MRNLYKKEYKLNKLTFDEISHVVVTSIFSYGQIRKKTEHDRAWILWLQDQLNV
jgi:hypothetical protein